MKSNDIVSLDALPEFFPPAMLTTVFPISRSTVYRMLNQGSIPCLRVGRRFILSKSHLARWIKQALDGKAANELWQDE